LHIFPNKNFSAPEKIGKITPCCLCWFAVSIQKDMEKTVMISMPMEDFQSVIIDCVNACLRNTKPVVVPAPSPNDSPQLLSIKQASTMLGLSVPTLYGYVHRAEIPVCKRANRLYFTKADLLKWIEGGRKQTTTDIEAETNNFLANKKGVNHGK
jgi:predicted DNA-binding transcriptional regulator AlpA